MYRCIDNKTRNFIRIIMRVLIDMNMSYVWGSSRSSGNALDSMTSHACIIDACSNIRHIHDPSCLLDGTSCRLPSCFDVEYIQALGKGPVARQNVTSSCNVASTNRRTERVTIATYYTQQDGRSANHDQ